MSGWDDAYFRRMLGIAERALVVNERKCRLLGIRPARLLNYLDLHEKALMEVWRQIKNPLIDEYLRAVK